MHGLMRIITLVLLVPTLTAAVVRSPLVSRFVQLTEVLPPNVAAPLESLPFEPNTSLTFVALLIFIGGAMLFKHPAMLLGAGVAGPLAFAYFPFGLVQWGGSAIQEAYKVRTEPMLVDHALAAAPVIVLMAILLIDRLRLDAKTLADRGIDPAQLRRATAGGSIGAIIAAVAAGALSIMVGVLAARAPWNALADSPWLQEGRIIIAGTAALLAMLGIMLLVRGGGADATESGARRIVGDASAEPEAEPATP